MKLPCIIPKSTRCSQPDGSGATDLLFRYGMSRRDQMVTRFKQSGRMLDVGCATGVFLQWFQAGGSWDLYGLELSEGAARVARAAGLNVFIGQLEEAAYPENYFDVVTFWDVLEHISDPRSALLETRRILKPDGILVLRLPNAASLDARIFRQYWSGLDAPRHFVRLQSR